MTTPTKPVLVPAVLQPMWNPKTRGAKMVNAIRQQLYGTLPSTNSLAVSTMIEASDSKSKLQAFLQSQKEKLTPQRHYVGTPQQKQIKYEKYNECGRNNALEIIESEESESEESEGDGELLILELSEEDESGGLDPQHYDINREIRKLKTPFEVEDIVPQHNKRVHKNISEEATEAINDIKKKKKAKQGLEPSPPQSPPSPYNGILLQMGMQPRSNQ